MYNYPTKKWRETSPVEQGIDKRVFEVMQKSICENFAHINSVLVIKNSCIVFEKYFNGYRKNSKQKVGCIFKSFVATVVGIALNENLIESLDTRVVDIFPDYKERRKDTKFNQITLEHALTKTTGLKWKGPDYYQANKEKFINNVEKFYELEVSDNPGEVFEYKPDPQIAVCAIEHLSSESFEDYCNRKLFQPLNISDYYWHTSMDDIENMKMTARDIAKLGYLYLKKGIWEYKQLFSEKYCKEATSEKIRAISHENTGYGYSWWVKKFCSMQTFYASGFGGQYLCVIPVLDMVVVITSQMDCPHMENKSLIRNLIFNMNLNINLNIN